MKSTLLVSMLLSGCGTPGTAVPTPDAAPDAWPTHADIVPPAGIVGWWSFDSSTDPVQRRYELGFGGPFFSAYGPGYRRKGMNCDGDSQYAITFGTETLRPDAFTIGAWVRSERIPADYEVVVSRSYGTQDDVSYALSIDSHMHLVYASQGGSVLVSESTIANGEWTHVALSFDGTTKRIYINGALAGSDAAPVPVTWDDHMLFIGADEGATQTRANDFLFGAIDEVMVFDRVLDPTEISGL